MLRRIQTALLTMTIAFIGADRVDFFGGGGPFRLVPFLLFGWLYCAVAVFHYVLLSGGEVRISPAVRRQGQLVAMLLLMCALIAVSTLFGLDPGRGLMQSLLLCLLLGMTGIISYDILNRPDRKKLIESGIFWGVILYVLSCVVLYYSYSHGHVQTTVEGKPGFLDLEVPALGPWIPRLAGATGDPNRAGFVSVAYIALLDLFEIRTRRSNVLRNILRISVFVTISNTAILCLAAYYMVMPKTWKSLTTRRTQRFLAAGAAGLAAGAFVFRRTIARLWELWSISDILAAKQDTNAGTSGQIHLALIKFSLETWVSSVKTFFLGIGFGGERIVLYGFYGSTNRSANFHSLYGTFLADFGLPTACLLMVILVVPLVKRQGAVPIMVSMMVFNIGYLTSLEPIFWLMIWLVWSLPERSSGKQDATTTTPGEPFRIASSLPGESLS